MSKEVWLTRDESSAPYSIHDAEPHDILADWIGINIWTTSSEGAKDQEGWGIVLTDHEHKFLGLPIIRKGTKKQVRITVEVL